MDKFEGHSRWLRKGPLISSLVLHPNLSSLSVRWCCQFLADKLICKSRFPRPPREAISPSFSCNNSFSEMTVPALVVAGDKDKNINCSERDDWRADAYHLSSGPKFLLTILGGEHILGGVSGYDAAETTVDSPERGALVPTLTLAYLRTALFRDDSSWADAQRTLLGDAHPKAKIESK